MRRRLLYTSLAAGLISIVSQSLIIRELVIAFLGNELVIGVTLGAWLLWTGVGSATFGRAGERSRFPSRWLAGELIALAILLPVCFLAATHAPTFAGLEDGEIAGPLPMMITCLLLLCPFCVVNGTLFPSLCRAVSESLTREAAIARVYVWEAIGSAVGGVVFTFFIVRAAEPLHVILGCTAAALVLARLAPKNPNRKLQAVVWVLLACVLALFLRPWMFPTDRREHINTIYGRTTVRRSEETVSVFHNGLLSSTFPTAGTSESLVHLAMLQVERPQGALLIAGLGGTADVALQYAGVEVDIVELDPESVDFVRRSKPRSPLDDAIRSGRARLHFEDARRYVAHYDGRPYDAIILNLPKPVTAQINRYYTVEFFRSAKRILAEGGVLAFSVESAPNLSTPELRDFIACLRRTLAAVFDGVVVAPGGFNVFVAAARQDQLTLDADRLLARLRDRRIKTEIFDATAQGDLNPFKVQELDEILAESRSTRINTDLHPISYSQALAVWTAKERTPRSGALQFIIDRPIRWLNVFASWRPVFRLGVGAALVLLCIALILVWRPRRPSAAGLAVACSGFTEITIEIVALLAFQALYGYVYAILGLILASFMTGLCVGGVCASRIIRSSSRPFRWLLGTQWALAAYPLLLIAVIWGAARTAAAGWPVVAAFLALTFVAGFTGGVQFPLAASVASTAKHNVAAKFSALDLCGAALGAIVVSTFLIPTVGFVTLALLISCLGAVALTGLYTARTA